MDADATPAVGIVGGHGGIGRLFGRLLAAAGAPALVSDRGTELTNSDLAARCDLILVAVPLRATPAVLSDIAPHVRPDAALASLGSLMEPSLPALGRCAGHPFLLHPLFGPGRRGLRGATLALAAPGLRPAGWSPGQADGPANGDPASEGPRNHTTATSVATRRRDWLLDLLRGRGATVVITTPEEHDRAMAVAQALLHGVGAALASQALEGLPGPDPLAWASPTLRLHLALMARILHQNPRLYGDLLALNRHAPAAIDALIGRLSALRDAMTSGPGAADAVADLFAAARDALGPLGQALAAEGDQALGEGSDQQF